MELTAYGSIIKFAVARESEIAELAQRMMQNQQLAILHELLVEISGESAKSIKLLERTLRENINEIVIEPISGLDDAPFLCSSRTAAELSETECRRCLGELLANAGRFYQVAAPKVPIEEAKRLFKRLEKNKLALQAALAG